MSATPPCPRGMIFDLDGTLVDSFEDITTAVNDTRAHYGQPPIPLEQVRAAVGNGSEALVRVVVPVPPERLPEALAHYLRCYDAVALQHTRLLPGVQATLEHFRSHPLAVVTNKPQSIARRILQALGVWERFRIVLGGDALPRRKPDPMPVQRVLACFALPATDVLLVGDGLQDVAAARAAGVRCVGVATGVTPREALQQAGAEPVLEGLGELVALYG